MLVESNHDDFGTKRREIAGTNFFILVMLGYFQTPSRLVKKTDFLIKRKQYIHTVLQKRCEYENKRAPRVPNEFHLIEYAKCEILVKKLDICSSSSWHMGVIYVNFLDFFAFFGYNSAPSSATCLKFGTHIYFGIPEIYKFQIFRWSHVWLWSLKPIFLLITPTGLVRLAPKTIGFFLGQIKTKHKLPEILTLRLKIPKMVIN